MNPNNQNITHLKRCKICGNDNLEKVIQIEEQYISATFVKSNENNQLTKIKTPLTLVLCSTNKDYDSCGHLQLLEITEPDLLYRNYFYRSATSDTMRADLKKVVRQATSIAMPNSSDVIVDIGSNDCTMLNFYDNKFKLLGFEPAKNIKYIDDGKNITVISNYFNADEFNKHSSKKAKIITSCAMFYDLADPKKFVEDIEKIISDDGIWCVQISYLASMLRYNNFYDICHEHLSYHSIKSFEHLIKQFNLKLFYGELNAVNGGSIRLYVCKNSCKKYENPEYSHKLQKLKEDEKKYKLEEKNTFFNFQKTISMLKDATNNFVSKIINSKQKVLALGASTKGNILLQHFGLDKSKIPYISERNPEKVGLKCLGSDIELISEEKARTINPAAFIVLPWNFKDEIVKREKTYLDNGGMLMFPMPYPHVVTNRGEEKL
jgi:hypothetical protein